MISDSSQSPSFRSPRMARALRVIAWRVAFAPAVLPLVAAALAVPSAHAQEFRGTISGTVADSTGAAIPGAQVVVRETRTGTVNNTKSDSAGQYVVPFLLPGTYSITVSMPGFQQTVRSGITLQSQEHPIINIALQVGESSTVVNVTSNAPLIDQANASVGQVISTESVEDLPLNGRTPTTFTELSEGVITTTPPQIIHPFDNAAGNSWSLGGTPNQVSEVLLDGSPDLTLLGALAYAPTQDSIQEVSVRPFDTDASEGHTIGGVINQITRSGTNGLHGSLYEFYQTAGLDANSYFNKRQGAARPNAHFNQYGGTIGGPIVLPKLFNGRDKAFFFLALEGLRDSTPFTGTPYVTVPTAAERTGDFSQTLYAACNGNKGGPYTINANTGVAYCNDTPTVPDTAQIYNPYTPSANGTSVTRQAIRNNNLASVAPINPIAANYLKLIPLPNTTASAVDGINNYYTAPPSIDTYSNEFGRLDFNVSSRDHLFGDFRHNHRTQVKNNFFGNGITGTTLLRENYGSTIDNVYTLNSTTVIDTRVNWTYFDEVHGTLAQQYNASTVGLPAGLSGGTESQLPCIYFGGTSISPSLGSTTCGGQSTSTFQSIGDNTSALDPTTSYQVFTDVVKTAGRHTIKIGFDGRQYRLSVQNFGNSDGSLDFGSSFITASNTSTQSIPFGGDLASFYFGLPSSGALDNNVRADYHSYYIGTFVQDDWRVSDKLTFNLGVRFDIDTPFEEKAGKTVNGFNPLATNTTSAAAATAYAAKPNAIVGTTLNTLGGLTFPAAHNGAVYNTNSGFLSPRVGFSYSPDSKTVLRGGFGIFVQPETLQSIASTGVTSSNAISNNEGFSATTTYTATNNNYVTPANTLSNPFPTGFTTPTGSAAGASTFLGQSISFLAPNQHDIYSERYDVGVQRSLTNSTLLEVLYVGNHSLHLPIASQNLNAARLQFLSTGPYRNQNIATAYATQTANPYAGLLPNGGSFNNANVPVGNLLVPFPQFGTNAVTEQNQTIGQSYFNSAIVHVEQRSRHGLTLTANYSFSKLIEADTFLNDEDTVPTRRISPFDHTHHFTTGATYNLPFGKGKAFSFGGSRIADEILGGFVVNGIYQFQTGAPVLFSADIPLAPGATIRSITNSPRNTSPVPGTGQTGTPALNTAAFVTGSQTVCPVTNGCNGNLFINGQYTYHYRTLPQTISTVRSDGFNNLDASLLKNFNFTEKTYLQLRFEAFNALNHAVFAAPNVSSATASNFGYITGTIANSQPRQVQLGGRFVF